jgi:putative DNA primase/helicase
VRRVQRKGGQVTDEIQEVPDTMVCQKCDHEYDPKRGGCFSCGVKEAESGRDLPAERRAKVQARLDEAITDPRLAEAFSERHGHQVRFDVDRKRWLRFEGHTWDPDSMGMVRLMVLETIRALQHDAIASDARDREKRLAQLVVAENRVSQIVTAAEPYCATRAVSFDADVWVVGAPNGTVDLRTGEVRQGRPEDMVTKQLGAPWDTEARSALWEQVLVRALPDEDVREFLQQLAGLTLAGQVGENLLPVFYGVPRSSKGTIIDAMKAAFGDYARAADMSTLARRKYEDGGAPRPDLVNLLGARLVAVYEAGRRFRLDTALVKTLSGSDPITARTLHEKPITFYPQFLIWLATDTRPEVPHDDAAFFERLCEVPFRHGLRSEDRDPNLRATLKQPQHGSAVLAWAFQGLKRYTASGKLVRPAAVQQAGAAYRDAMDPVRAFFEECCTFGPELWTAAGALRAAYEGWCKEEGERYPVAGKQFAEALAKRGGTKVKRNHVRGWRGVGLRDAGATVQSTEDAHHTQAGPGLFDEREAGSDDI